MDYEDLIDKYNALINKICYYFASNTDEFNDLKQEVMINLWLGLSSFRKDSSLSTWVYRVCFNTCISLQRKNKKNKIPISIENILDVADDEGFDVSKFNEMHALIRRLNVEERAIILMWLDEKTYEEISEITGLNRNTLAVRLKRIKEKLVKMSNC